MVLTRCGALALPSATSYTSTPSPPVRPSSRCLSSGVTNTSAGIGPVVTRCVSACVARSITTSSLLSCMLTQAVVLLLSIHRWLGVRALGRRLTSVGAMANGKAAKGERALRGV